MGGDVLRRLRGHPWVLELPLRAPTTPAQLAWLHRGYGRWPTPGSSEDEKASTVLLLNGHVFSQARFVVDLGAPDDVDRYIEGLTELIDAERFPARGACRCGKILAPARQSTLDYGLCVRGRASAARWRWSGWVARRER